MGFGGFMTLEDVHCCRSLGDPLIKETLGANIEKLVDTAYRL